VLLLVGVILLGAPPPQTVSFTAPNGDVIAGDLYGTGTRGVVIVGRRLLHTTKLATAGTSHCRRGISGPGLRHARCSGIRSVGRKLFLTAREDANAAGLRLPGIRAQFYRAPEPKTLVLLEGSAPGQRIFQTEQGDAVLQIIVGFLSKP
jgi:hypothetical protein